MRISDWSSDVCSSDLFARKFAAAIHAKFPGKLLAYNCSPSFNWKKHLDDATIASFQRELATMGNKFQRSEEHTSELQSLMRISYAVFCLKKTTIHRNVRISILQCILTYNNSDHY